MSAAGVAAIGQGVIGGVNIAFGIGSKRRARKKRRRAQKFFEQNKYEIPESARASLDVAQRQASEVALPGQDVLESRLGQTTAQGVGAAQEVSTTSSDVLGVLTNLYGSQQMRQQDIGLQAAQQYSANQANLQQSLNTMAGYEEQKWKYNVLYPYQQQMAAAGQLRAEGTQQISQGLGQVAGAVSGYGQYAGAQQGLQQQYANIRNLANPMVQVPQGVQPIGFQPLANPYNQGQLMS